MRGGAGGGCASCSDADNGSTLKQAELSVAREEAGPGGRYQVQETKAGENSYVCPGCGGSIAVGTWHVVAWPIDSLLDGGVRARRHWHSGCWKARFGRSRTF